MDAGVAINIQVTVSGCRRLVWQVRWVWLVSPWQPVCWNAIFFPHPPVFVMVQQQPTRKSFFILSEDKEDSGELGITSPNRSVKSSLYMPLSYFQIYARGHWHLIHSSSLVSSALLLNLELHNWLSRLAVIHKAYDGRVQKKHIGEFMGNLPIHMK